MTEQKTEGEATGEEKTEAASARPTKHAASAATSTPANTNRTPPTAKTLAINLIPNPKHRTRCYTTSRKLKQSDYPPALASSSA